MSEQDFHRPMDGAYIRLSQDDLRAPGPIEEKFAIRKVIAQRLAAQHSPILPEDLIIIEKGSGGSAIAAVASTGERDSHGSSRQISTPSTGV